MFKFRLLLQKIHISLSQDLGDALKSGLIDPAYLELLYISLIFSFAAIFLTEGYIAHIIFIYVLIPIIFAPFKFNRISFFGLVLILPMKFSFYNLFRNTILCRTPLFLMFLAYGVNKAYLSYLYPEPNIGYLHIFFYYLLLPLVVFNIAVIRLSVDLKNYYYMFFLLMGKVAALNALINLYFYLKSMPDISYIRHGHMTAVYGAAIGHNPNLDCIIYAIYLAGLFVVMINRPFCKIDYIAIFSAVILFLTILLEQSRSTLLGLFIVIFLLSFLSPKKIMVRSKIFLVITFLLILIFSFLFLKHGFATYFLRGDSARSDIWLRYINVLLEDPFVGYGDRTVRGIIMSTGEPQLHAHSILLSSWLRGGLIGLCSMIYIAIFGIKRSLQYALVNANYVPFCIFVVVLVDGIFNSELKIWQAGWEWAGYWLAIATVLGADAALRNKEVKSCK